MTEPPSLGDLQRWLAILVQHADDTEAAARTPAAASLIPRGAVLAGEIVTPTDRQSPLQRLQVYNGGYVARLIEVLETDYRALKYALGDRWRELAAACCYAHPSRHPNLNGFGKHLPGFLAARADLEHRDCFADLAALEWAMTEAFAAPDFEPFDMTRLQGIPEASWAGATFTPNPSLSILTTTYPVNGFLQEFLDGAEPDIPAPEATHVAVYRKEMRVWRLKLPAPMAAILRALCAGTPFGEALGAGGEHDEDIGRWFQEWSGDGLFTEVALPPET